MNPTPRWIKWAITCILCIGCSENSDNGDASGDSSSTITGDTTTSTATSDTHTGALDTALLSSGSDTDAPLASDDESDEGCESPFVATPLVEDAFNAGWATNQTIWRRASWMQNGTQMSPERCVENSAGLLEQTVMAGEPFLGGSMQSRTEFSYGRWVARLKPAAVPGVLNSMFTMDWDDMTTQETDGDGTHEEIDIEFLTYTFGPNTGSVHFAVHKPPHTNYFVEDITLGFNPSDAFHEWGFDVLPDRITWHVDGEELATYLYDDTVSITGNYEMFFNSWTRESWINGPPETNAVYQIDWVRHYPLKDACK